MSIVKNHVTKISYCFFEHYNELIFIFIRFLFQTQNKNFFKLLVSVIRLKRTAQCWFTCHRDTVGFVDNHYILVLVQHASVEVFGEHVGVHIL